MRRSRGVVVDLAAVAPLVVFFFPLFFMLNSSITDNQSGGLRTI